MVIVHAYLKLNGNIITTMPLRYNDGDDMPVTARELVLDVTPEETIDSIRQRIVKQFDEEKANYGQADEYASGMSGVVTIE